MSYEVSPIAVTVRVDGEEVARSRIELDFHVNGTERQDWGEATEAFGVYHRGLDVETGHRLAAHVCDCPNEATAMRIVKALGILDRLEDLR